MLSAISDNKLKAEDNEVCASPRERPSVNYHNCGGIHPSVHPSVIWLPALFPYLTTVCPFARSSWTRRLQFQHDLDFQRPRKEPHFSPEQLLSQPAETTLIHGGLSRADHYSAHVSTAHTSHASSFKTELHKHKMSAWLILKPARWDGFSKQIYALFLRHRGLVLFGICFKIPTQQLIMCVIVMSHSRVVTE